MDVPTGKIVVDYGRPQLKGRDPLTWQKEGTYWRMGTNDMTTLETPVGLVFGTTKLPAGKYGLWLLKGPADRYELVFNKQTQGHGMVHNAADDVASVFLKKISTGGPVETYTIDLKKAGGGGTFVMSWGTATLSADFSYAQ
jgi:hypothetical protein